MLAQSRSKHRSSVGCSASDFFSCLCQVAIFLDRHEPECAELGGVVQQRVCHQLNAVTVDLRLELTYKYLYIDRQDSIFFFMIKMVAFSLSFGYLFHV